MLYSHIEDGCSKRFEISSDYLQLSSESGAPPTSPSPAPQRTSPPGPIDLANGTGHMFTTSVMHAHQPLATPSQPPLPQAQAQAQPLGFDSDSTACMAPSMLPTSGTTDAAGSAGGVASTVVDLSSTSPVALSAASAAAATANAAAAMHGPHSGIITADNGCYW